MKKIYLLLIISLAYFSALAQAPQAFKYQAIARDEAGNVLSMWEVGLRVSLIKAGSDGQAVYVETHRAQTNIYGLINIIIGEGLAQKGDIGSINWGENKHFLRMEMDINGGEDYKEIGVSQLYAVPYALYAEQAGTLLESEEKVFSAEKSPKRKPNRSGGQRNGTPNTKFPADTNSFMNVNAGSVGIGTTDPQEKLDVIGKIMSTLGYSTNGDDGQSDTENLVSDIDFDNLKLKYRTLAFSGGILTVLSDTSDWVDTVGNFLGMNANFMCGEDFYDSRDGKQYSTVLIMTQCWMAENINIGLRIDGANEQIDNDTIEKYCYNDDPANCGIYGGLYKWDEMMQYVSDTGAQGICPSGWHIPSDEEWKILEGTVDSFYPVGDPEWDGTSWRGFDAGYHLKSTTGWNSSGNGDDSFGFTALPAGHRLSNGNFYNLGDYAHFWSSTEAISSSAWYRRIYYDIDEVYQFYSIKLTGSSVRCLRDE
jgi:uncharacterized protein (TIGR02145 family)